MSPDGHTYSVRDTRKTLAWEAGIDVVDGVPRTVLRCGGSFATGTLREYSFRKEVASNDELRSDVVVDYSFSSGEGNALIESAAGRLGMRKTMNGIVKGGLILGVVAAGGAGIGLAIAALTGNLG